MIIDRSEGSRGQFDGDGRSHFGAFPFSDDAQFLNFSRIIDSADLQVPLEEEGAALFRLPGLLVILFKAILFLAQAAAEAVVTALDPPLSGLFYGKHAVQGVILVAGDPLPLSLLDQVARAVVEIVGTLPRSSLG